MGQTLSNCVPSSPGEQSTGEGYNQEDQPVANKRVDQREKRGLKLQKPKVSTLPQTEQCPKDSSASTHDSTSQQLTSSNKKSATKPVLPEDQDFFSDMEPKYAPPPTVNRKPVSRLTMDSDHSGDASTGWDDALDTTDSNKEDTQKIESKQYVKKEKQKLQLDSTITNESFDDFDD